MHELTIAPVDPRSPEVLLLLERHHEFAGAHSPPEDVHALDVDGLTDPAVQVFGCRVDGQLLGIGALKRIAAGHVELKSLHTAAHARRRGVARALLDRLLSQARAGGFTRVSLETGSMAAFLPARTLYAGAGFEECGPFGDYAPSRYSTFMTLRLDAPRPEPAHGGAPPGR